MQLTSDGGRPLAGVIQGKPDGMFYGTAICGGSTGSCDQTLGTLFKVAGDALNPDSSSFQVLHAFTGADDGGIPQGGLIQAADGYFYGMTNCGGVGHDCNVDGGSGTIYRVNYTGTIFETVHTFDGVNEGTGPYGSLVQGRDGNLYGMTWCGGGGLDCLALPAGEDGGGTVFKFDPVSSAVTVLHTFGNDDPLGCKPLANLVEDQTADGVFYGTTNNCGGPSGSGTIFKIDVAQPPATNLTVLHAFSGAAGGGYPVAGLTFGPDGTTLYGTTQFYGITTANPLGFGTIFQLNTDGSGFTTLYAFKGLADGGNPNAGLVYANDGTLYGTAFYPSPSRPTGTLFRLDPISGQYDTVYTFTGGADGQNPSATLVHVDEALTPGDFTGSLVGTTMLGPATLDGDQVTSTGNGVIFRFVPPPLLVCPANPDPVDATSPAGAIVSLTTDLIDPANKPSTIEWRIDGSLAQTDPIPSATTRTTKLLSRTYTAGLAGSAASKHTVVITASNAFGFTSTCTVTVEVDKLDQTIDFAAVPAQTYPNDTFTLGAIATSGLDVTYSVVSGAGAVSGNQVTLPGAGSSVVQASQDGDGQYNPATSVSQTLTVQKAEQAITFAPILNQSFANPAPALPLAPSSDSGLDVTLSVTGAATLTQNGPSNYTLTLTGAGNVTVTASQAGDSNYNAATDVVRSFTTAKGAQAITFPQPPPQVYSNPNGTVTLAATSDSGLSVSYAIVSGPGTLSGNVLTMTGAGSIVVQASQPGTNDFTAAAPVQRTVTVNKADQAITFPPIPAQTYSNPNGTVTLGATASSGLAVSYTVVSGPGTISGSTLTITGGGSIVISASQAGNTNYNAATAVPQTVTVAKANQSINFPAVPAQTYSNPNGTVTLGATATSGLTITYTVTSGPGTVSGSVLTITGAGSIVVTASQAGNANYNAATDAQQTVSVAKAAQTITFPQPAPQTFTNPNSTVTLTATASSGLPVSYAVASGPGTISGNVLTITGAGNVVVTASQAGNADYNAAVDVSRTIVVSKAAQTITFPPVPAQTYSNPNGTVTLAATASSGLAVSYAVTSGPGTIAGNVLTITGAGTIAITASQAGDADFNAAANVSQNVVVAKASQTITFPTVPPATFGDAPITLGASASSGLAVSYSVTGPGSISGNVLTITGAGTITITASQAGNANYNAAPDVPQSVAVAKASQTITFPQPAPQVFGNPPLTLTASASSNLTVTYTVVSGPGTIAGNVLTITGTGNIVVSASQAGNANYAAATPVQRTVAVGQAAQTITFPAIPAQTYLNPPITLAATASSGLAVSYTITGPATLSGNILTITGAGTIVVTATQAGNTNYTAAAPVSQTIAVAKASQTINFPAVPTQFTGNPPVTLTATASSGLPITYTAAGPGTISGSVLTITGAGTIVVTASQPGDSNYNAAAATQNITVLDATQSPLRRFVAFSTDLTWLHTNAVVITGDVGANLARIHDDDDDNDPGDDFDDRQTTVRLDNRVTMQQATSRVVGDLVRLGPGATIYNLFDNALDNHNGVVLGTQVNAVTLPYLTMPSFPSIAAGTQAIVVKKNTVVTLAAGTYDSISIENGGTLKLLGGLYQMTSLDVAVKGTVEFEAAAELRVRNTVSVGTSGRLVVNAAVTGLSAASVKIYVAGADKNHGNADAVPVVVNFGNNATVQANVYAPSGTISFKTKSQGTGAFIGKHVLIGTSARLTLDSSFF